MKNPTKLIEEVCKQKEERPPQIDGFTYVKQLGRGHAGTVWLATDDRGQTEAGKGGEIAIKVFDPIVHALRRMSEKNTFRKMVIGYIKYLQSNQDEGDDYARARAIVQDWFDQIAPINEKEFLQDQFAFNKLKGARNVISAYNILASTAPPRKASKKADRKFVPSYIMMEYAPGGDLLHYVEVTPICAVIELFSQIEIIHAN